MELDGDGVELGCSGWDGLGGCALALVGTESGAGEAADAPWASQALAGLAAAKLHIGGAVFRLLEVIMW